MRGALSGDGRVLGPARWSVREGRTLSLEQDEPGEGERIADVVLLPGLVNAHAHLDLGGAEPLDAAGSFPDWLLRVGGARKDGRDLEASAEAEARSLGERGVVDVGDIDATGGHATRGRREAGLPGRSYIEVVGVDRGTARRRLAGAVALADRLGGGAAGIGLSPHAPYSVDVRVVEEIGRASACRRLPLAMHLAESVEESRYLEKGDGPFVSFLETIGRGAPFAQAPGLRPIEYAERTGLLERGCLVIHGNDLSDDDIGRLARHGSAVVYCHGTHRHFDRPQHRWLDLRRAGVEVALGTDSGASNARVDLFAEIGRILEDRPDVDPVEVLRAATLGGRRALGRDEGSATFRRGSVADAVLVGPRVSEVDVSDPAGLVAWAFSGEVEPTLTLHRGRPIAGSDDERSASCALLDTLTGHG